MLYDPENLERPRDHELVRFLGFATKVRRSLRAELRTGMGGRL
jgi:hypothetical protein